MSGANDIPGAYEKAGDLEIFEGDFVFAGEENHHAKRRGWTYWLYTCRDGKLVHLGISSNVKDAIKAIRDRGELDKGEAKTLLLGAGDVAAMVRRARLDRLFPLSKLAQLIEGAPAPVEPIPELVEVAVEVEPVVSEAQARLAEVYSRPASEEAHS